MVNVFSITLPSVTLLVYAQSVLRVLFVKWKNIQAIDGTWVYQMKNVSKTIK
jgi:hypothetical protein